MQFQTEFNRFDTVYTNPGTKFIAKYQEALDSKGKRYLKKVGESNVYEKIQASLDETLVYNVLEKFAQSGDAAILMQRESIFGDFTNIPKTPLELQNLIMKAEAQFDQLDKDVRAAFDNDSGVFKQSILDGSFEEKIAKFRKSKTGVQAPAPAKQAQAQAPASVEQAQAPAPVEQTQTQSQTSGGVNLNE